MPQGVVVEFIHQREQRAQFAFRKTFAREPAEVVAGQIGQQPALVFAVRHGERDKALQMILIHRVWNTVVNDV